MNISLRKLSRVALVIVPLVAFAACGGSDDGGGFGDAVAESDAGGESQDSSGDSSSSSGESSGDAGSGLPSAKCLEIGLSMANALGAATEDPDALYGLPDAFESIRDEVPDELRGDIDILVAEYRAYAETLKKYDGDMIAMFSDPAAATLMSSDEFTAANERVSAWFDGACGG